MYVLFAAYDMGVEAIVAEPAPILLRLHALREWVDPILDPLFEGLRDQFLRRQESISFTVDELTTSESFASPDMLVAFALRKIQILSELIRNQELGERYAPSAMTAAVQLESLLYLIQDRSQEVGSPGFEHEEHRDQVTQTLTKVRALLRWCLSRYDSATTPRVGSLVADTAAQYARSRPDRPKPTEVTALATVLPELASGIGLTFGMGGLSVLFNLSSAQASPGDIVLYDADDSQAVLDDVHPVLGELDPTHSPRFFAIMLLRKLGLLTIMTQPGVPTLARFLLPYLSDAHTSLLNLNRAVISHRTGSGNYDAQEVLRLNSDYQDKASYLAAAARSVFEVMRNVPHGLDGDILLR